MLYSSGGEVGVAWKGASKCTCAWVGASVSGWLVSRIISNDDNFETDERWCFLGWFVVC